MIQFLILGQVPGTHFQITFGWFQLVMVVAVAAAAYYVIYIRGMHNLKAMQQQFEAVSLQSLDQA